MRWPDERYVRVYTRDTSEWVALSWEARSIFLMMLRVSDRAGIIPLGRKSLGGLAIMMHVPGDVLERAVMELAEDGCISCDGFRILIRNFINAQEVPISDAQRKRDQRERDHARSLLSSGEKLVLSPVVPAGHEVTQPVTPNRAEPNQAFLTKPEDIVAADAPPSPPTPEELQTLWNGLKAAEQPVWDELSKKRRALAKARLEERPLHGTRGWDAVIARIAASSFARGLVLGSNGNTWIAGPDWLLQADVAAKVLEGKYDDRAEKRRPSDPRKSPIRAEEMHHGPVGEVVV